MCAFKEVKQDAFDYDLNRERFFSNPQLYSCMHAVGFFGLAHFDYGQQWYNYWPTFMYVNKRTHTYITHT